MSIIHASRPADLKTRCRAGCILYGKGMMMGIADLVPGISGATVAMMTGIYTQLLTILASLSGPFFKCSYTDGVVVAWRVYQLNVLCLLGLGMLTSIWSFSYLVSHWYATYPQLVLAFFFGIVLASTFGLLHIYHRYCRLSLFDLVLCVGVAGTVVILLMLLQTPAELDQTPSFGTLFVGGMVPVCPTGYLFYR